MPLFLLMGGEFVIAFLLLRIAVWIMMGRRTLEPPPPPPGPGVSIARLSRSEPSRADSPAAGAPLKRAA